MSSPNLPVPGDLTTVDKTEFCAAGPPADTPQPVLAGDLIGRDDPPSLNGVWELTAGTLVTVDADTGIVGLQSGAVTILACEHPLVFDTVEGDGQFFESPAGLGVQLDAGTNPGFLLAIAESGGTVALLADADSVLDISLLGPSRSSAVCGTEQCWGLDDKTREPTEPDAGTEVCVLNKCWTK